MRLQQATVTLVCFLLSLALMACGGAITNSNGSPSSPARPLFAGFAPRIDLSGAGTKPQGVAVADFDGDGYLDIATSWQSNQIAVYLGRGAGTFAAPMITSVAIPNTLGNISVGDFNEDGRPDIVAATIAGLQSDLVFLGKGDGTFQQPTAIPNSGGFFEARVIDVNGDKHQDIVISGNGGNVVYLGKGDGTFMAAPALPSYPGLGLAGAFLGLGVGDFNGDKNIDFVVTDTGSPTGSLYFYAGNGDGTFRPPVMISDLSYGPNDLCAADFNGDGKLDLLIGSAGAIEWTMLGDGNGSFHQVGSFSALPLNLQTSFSIAAADFDLDGALDVVAADYSSGKIFVLLNDHSGKFGIGSPPTSNFTLAGLPQTSRVAVGDLNNDGIPDIVTISAADNGVSAFLAIGKK